MRTLYFFLLIIVGCKNSGDRLADAPARQQRLVGNFIIDCVILPQSKIKSSALLTHEQLKIDNHTSYAKNIILSIYPNPDRIGRSDMLMDGQSSWEMYQNRMEELNFHMEDRFEIHREGITSKAALVNFENYYGLKNKFVFNVAFSCSSPIQDDFEVIYKDEFFDLGNVHFFFKRS